MSHSGPKFSITILSSSQQSNTKPSAPPSQNRLVDHTPKQLNSPHLKSHHLKFLIENHKHKKPRNTHTQSLLLPNLQIDLVLLDNLPLYPAIGNPISTQMSTLRHTTSSCLRLMTFCHHPSLRWYWHPQHPSQFAKCKHPPSSRWRKLHHSHSLWTQRIMRG